VFHPSDHDVELSEEEFRLLRDLIHERFGLYYDDNQRASLRTRLSGRLKSLALSSFEDYYHHLRFSPHREEELKSLVSHLTNNETYFFREIAQLNVLADHVLKTVKERKSRSSDRTLRVLSAGCSTGEEVYTVAMILHDSGQFFWNWQTCIVGLDVDPQALEKARRGLYFHNSFRATGPAVIERHFVKDGAGCQVKEAIKRLVQFRRGNILEPESYEGLADLDVILCRNVLIYFSDSATQKVARQFFELLAPGGYLLLGHAESLSRITDAFTPIRFKGAMIYQKPDSPLARGAEGRR
jgi:chemotaxis protein methyltransferase CheR